MIRAIFACILGYIFTKINLNFFIYFEFHVSYFVNAIRMIIEILHKFLDKISLFR